MTATTLPPGVYTLTITNDCGYDETKTVTYNFPGGYNYTDLGYTSELTCAGMKITPTGRMTYQGNVTNTYFKFANGPAGHDRTVIPFGGSFILSTPGTYVLGISNSNTPAACNIATQTINYTAPPMILAPELTSAYVCVGGTIGDISIKAVNGVAPYTYELWNEANTDKEEDISDVVTGGIAHFHGGRVNSTYTVRISDACGNSFSQQVTLTNLETARIVYSEKAQVCTGDAIQLNCITLGITTYGWTGPEGFASTGQNPTITDAQQDMSGWYKVSVTPEYCGVAVEDSVYITVYPPLTAGPIVGNQTVGVRMGASVLSSETVGGGNTYTYQWQFSEDGLSWTIIPGATTAAYQPPVQIKSGTYYYRKVSTDICGTVYSDPIAVVVNPGYIPVNPDIKSMGGHI
jgi:hypothetical protein